MNNTVSFACVVRPAHIYQQPNTWPHAAVHSLAKLLTHGPGVFRTGPRAVSKPIMLQSAGTHRVVDFSFFYIVLFPPAIMKKGGHRLIRPLNPLHLGSHKRRELNHGLLFPNAKHSYFLLVFVFYFHGERSVQAHTHSPVHFVVYNFPICADQFFCKSSSLLGGF